MSEEEIAYCQAQEEEYYSQHGACPNCGKTVHVSDLGKEPDGTVCCVNCYEEYRKSSDIPEHDKYECEECLSNMTDSYKNEF